MLSTVESVIIIILFIVPGYISLRTKSALTITGKQSAFGQTVQSIIFSCLNYTIWLPIWVPLSMRITQVWFFRTDSLPLPSVSSLIRSDYVLLALLILFVSPALLGLLVAIVVRKRYLHEFSDAIANKLGIVFKSSSTPELWDHLFEDREFKPWVRVYLNDGRIYQGIGDQFSTYPSERQMWITSPQVFDEKGDLICDLEKQKVEGVFINLRDIEVVEVFSGEKEST